MANSKKKKNTGFAFACWLLVALVLLVFFFVKKDTMLTNLKKTDFFGRVFGKTPEFISKHEIKEEPTDNGLLQIQIDPNAPIQDSQSTKSKKTSSEENNLIQPDSKEESSPETNSLAKENDTQKEIEKPSTEKTELAKTQDTTKEQTASTKTTQKTASTNVQLCFVTVDASDGSVNRQLVTRALQKTESPLTDALRALLQGPLPEEKNKGSTTMIPSGTKLLSASVKNGVATLNFSEEFELMQQYGVQGYIAQLMQVVYTATNFSTVNSVQFILDGQRTDYLGSEGTWIGSPLSRSSFR